MTLTALIAEDEPLLRAALTDELQALWPALAIIAQVDNGDDALLQIRQLRPAVAFLDIRMPGLSGIEVAQAIAEDAAHDDAVPLIVFVSAYSEFAVEAFDQAAIDYVLKPVTRERLQRTIERLQLRLAEQSGEDLSAELSVDPTADKPRKIAQQTNTMTSVERLVQQLAPLLATVRPSTSAALKFVRLGQGNTVQMVAVEQVRYFQAADKYVIVTTAQGEGLIRESLRELQVQLNPDMFVQVHRSTIVNMGWVERADRNEAGHVSLKLRGVDRLLPVSRLYAHLFRAM